MQSKSKAEAPDCRHFACIVTDLPLQRLMNREAITQ
jgi:hypothetical protein